MGNIIDYKKLSINCISDNMLEFAIKEGYKVPSFSLKEYYGKPAQFFINYKNGIIDNYEFAVMNKNGKPKIIFKHMATN